MTGERFDARLLEEPWETPVGTVTTHTHGAGGTILNVVVAGDLQDRDDESDEPLEITRGYILVTPAGLPDVDPPEPFVIGYYDWEGELEEQEYILLASPLPVAVPIESTVEVWAPDDPDGDPSVGEVVTTYEARVMRDDDDADAEPLVVEVHPDITDTLKGAAIPAGGVPVIVETQESYYGPTKAQQLDVSNDDSLYLTRVLGGRLSRDGSALDRNTVPIPDGVVVDPDAPPETPPLVEAFGGIGSILLRVQETTVATDKIDLWTSTTSPVNTNRNPDDTMLGVSRAAHVIRRVEGAKVIAGTTYYIVAKARNVKGSSGPSQQISVTPAEATSDDVAVDLITTDMLLFNNAIGVALDLADLYAVRITGARIRTAIAGARCEVFVDDNGRGRIRFFDDFDNVIGAIQAISEGGTQRFTIGSGGPNGARIRYWADTNGYRYVDVISDIFNVFGLIQGTNGLTLQLSPTVMKGFDFNSNVSRTLSSEGTTVVTHNVAGGGSFNVTCRGGNLVPSIAAVTGTDVTFRFRNPDGSLAVNASVTFDWQVFAFQR